DLRKLRYAHLSSCQLSTMFAPVSTADPASQSLNVTAVYVLPTPPSSCTGADLGQRHVPLATVDTDRPTYLSAVLPYSPVYGQSPHQARSPSFSLLLSCRVRLNLRLRYHTVLAH